jgi:hypothetical protein
MKLLKRLLLVFGVATTFLIGYGAAAKAFPAGGLYGRGEYNGYFTNAHDTFGTYVLPASFSGNAFPASLDTAAELISFIKGGNGLASGANQRRTGAAFIIQTMIGSSRNRPPTAGEIAEWESRVNAAAAAGRISFFFNYSYNLNSYFQGTGSGSNPNDDAFYDGSGTAPTIVFRNSAGTIVYGIRRQCANPVGNGNISPIPDNPSFNTSGRTTVDNASPLPGQTITFRHYVRNNGPGPTAPTPIWWIAQNMPSQATTGGAASSGTYTAGQEKNVFNESVAIPAGTPAGTQYCRRVGWDPVNGSGGRDGRGATVCATVRYDFNLTPLINFTVNGAAPSGSIAEQGDSITFNYSVRNTGLTQSQLATCNIYGLSRPGSYTAPTPPDSASDGGYVPPPTGCPRTFPYNSTTAVTSETITATAANQTICRAFWVNPASLTVGAVGTETCIRIVAKPYLKVYGGDVAAGSGLETAPDTCTNNTNAAITSWNKRTPGNYAGAGVQYAGFALRAITDFATGRDNSVGLTTPSWLSFANTAGVNNGTGLYGGTFGSVPCIRDYYSLRPASTSALPANVSAMTTGIYGSTGATTLTGGTVNPGENITVYIDGNVFINSNITYTPNWSYTNTPLFQLVVRGNIYIGNGVTQLDGVYIAQRNGAAGGTIYTCATAAAAPTLTNGAFYNSCNSKLTINGAFMANSVEFLRTRGSLSQGIVNEPSGSSNAGEVFNFNPSLWMVQPLQSGGGSDNYDAITSLPPVL